MIADRGAATLADTASTAVVEELRWDQRVGSLALAGTIGIACTDSMCLTAAVPACLLHYHLVKRRDPVGKASEIRPLAAPGTLEMIAGSQDTPDEEPLVPRHVGIAAMGAMKVGVRIRACGSGWPKDSVLATSRASKAMVIVIRSKSWAIPWLVATATEHSIGAESPVDYAPRDDHHPLKWHQRWEYSWMVRVLEVKSRRAWL